jgi:hypothetical protein
LKKSGTFACESKGKREPLTRRRLQHLIGLDRTIDELLGPPDERIRHLPCRAHH